MSAITKPFVHPTTAINTNEAVNIETVKDYSKLDIDGTPFNQPDEYQIVFTHNDNTTQRWRYTTSAARNTAYTNLQTAASTAI